MRDLVLGSPLNSLGLQGLGLRWGSILGRPLNPKPSKAILSLTLCLTFASWGLVGNMGRHDVGIVWGLIIVPYSLLTTSKFKT